MGGRWLGLAKCDRLPTTPNDHTQTFPLGCVNYFTHL